MSSIIDAVTTGPGGLSLTSDNSGILVLKSGGTPAVTIDAAQNVSFNNPLNAPNTFGFKNRIINGQMQAAQRGTSAVVTAGTAVPTASAGYPCVDRMFVYSVGGNPTAAQVAGSGNVLNRLQITGAASITSVGVGQRIEATNCADIAGYNAVLSVDLANSLLTTVTWTAYYATTTNTFGTIGTPTKTQIATGTWTVNSSIANYQATFAVPGAATTGIEILLTVGAQISGTWTIGNMQFEKGSIATSFDYRDYGSELIKCQRYFLTLGGGVQDIACQGYCSASAYMNFTLSYPSRMRIVPTAVTVGTWTTNSMGQPTLYPGISTISLQVQAVSTGGTTYIYTTAATYLTCSAEL